MSKGTPRLIREPAFCREYGLDLGTLRNKRSRGEPLIPYLKIGRAIYYDRDVVAQFLDRCRRGPSIEPDLEPPTASDDAPHHGIAEPDPSGRYRS